MVRMRSVNGAFKKLRQHTDHLQRVFRGELARKSFLKLGPLVQVQCLVNRLGLKEAELAKFTMLCEDEMGTVDLVRLEEMLRNHAESQAPRTQEERVLRELQGLVFNGTLTEKDVQEMIAKCSSSSDGSSLIDFDRLESLYKHIRDAQHSIEEEAAREEIKEESEPFESRSHPSRRKTIHEIEEEIDAITDDNEDLAEAVAQLIHTQLLPEDKVLEIVDACHEDENGQVDVHRFKELFVEGVYVRYQTGEYDHLFAPKDADDKKDNDAEEGEGGDIDELEQRHSKDKCQNMCTDRYMDIAGLQSKSERVCMLTRHTGEFAYNR